MDCNMPVMDGFQASQEIRKIDDIDQNNLYIIALTAYNDESFRQQCLKAGMNEFMTKPVSHKQLQSIFKEYALIW